MFRFHPFTCLAIMQEKKNEKKRPYVYRPHEKKEKKVMLVSRGSRSRRRQASRERAWSK